MTRKIHLIIIWTLTFFIGSSILIGVAGSLALSSAVESMLYGVSPTNPAALLGVALLLLLVAFLGSALPAIRAACVDPARTLRAG